MNRNEFIAQVSIELFVSADALEGVVFSHLLQDAINLANALEEAKCAPWVK